MKPNPEDTAANAVGGIAVGTLPGRASRSARERFLLALALAGIMATFVGVITAWALLGRTEALVQKSAAGEIQRHVSQHLTDALSGEEVTFPLAPDLYARIDQQVRESILSDEVIRVKIWSPSGEVLYSNVKTQEAESTSQNKGVDVAMKGQAWWEVGRVESTLDQREGSLLEIYMPLAPVANRAPVAVAEAYARYGPYAAMLGELRQSVAVAGIVIFLTLPLGLLLLYRVVWHDIVQQRDLANQRLREVDALNRLMQRDIAYALELREGVLALRREVSLTPATPSEATLRHEMLARQIGELGSRAEAFLDRAPQS